MTAQPPFVIAPFDRPGLTQWLADHDLAHTTYEHPPVFRVEEGLTLKASMPGVHTKNLFLKDAKGRLWLISAAQDTVIDLKRAHLAMGAARLSFGNEALMFETLGVRPGSVTAFGLINDIGRRVTFVLDRCLDQAEIVNFHPLTNTATTAMDRQTFSRFLDLIDRQPLVIDFSQTG